MMAIRESAALLELVHVRQKEAAGSAFAVSGEGGEGERKKISSSRFEVVNRDGADKYDKFYEDKELPASDTEGELQVLQFDGKGVPVIKREAAKIKARLGKGEKRQKKKRGKARKSPHAI
ncbi:MAG: hypothetical protein D3910_24580 [Candidatus Electrothrix sp. ATG2]|nr:hypothetical protein [Candidatus Electrothrix sp. ATG2]